MIPFILRGVSLLGIDSVMQPYANRVVAWARLGADLPLDRLDAMVESVSLAGVAQLGPAILKGEVKGRIVVEIDGILRRQDHPNAVGPGLFEDGQDRLF